MDNQRSLTIAAPVREECILQLRNYLQSARIKLEDGRLPIFGEMGTIHYARFLILEKDSNARLSVTTLVFATDYDGKEDAHFFDIVTKMTGFIDDTFGLCIGYPEAAARNAESRKQFLKSCAIKSDSFYVGAPFRSLQQIRQESLLRDFLWAELNKTGWSGKSAPEIHRALKQKVLSMPEFEWAKTKITVPRYRWEYYILIGIIAAMIAILDWKIFTTLWIFTAIVSVVIAVVVGWVVVLHFKHEIYDKPLGLTPSRISEPHIKILEEYEDLHNQNQFSQLIPIKPGFMRPVTINALMLYARLRIKVEFVKGKLMGIPTIHFARWLKVDNGKQMLFFSNFDGSWQQYLGDFIDKSGWGLTAIFSNTENFPVTRYLFWGGAYDEEHFLAWSRYYQIPTAVWYCAYPHLSIKNINNNTAIRHELMQDPDEAGAQKFLRRF